MAPNVLLALVEHGPDLIGRLLPAGGLALRAESCIPSHSLWWARWHEITKHRPLASTLSENAMAGSPRSQDALFEQVGRVLRVISQTFPLILLLDDLQWVDTGSASLLFHLGRHLARSRILIVGAYRPEMVTPDGAGRRHVLQPVVNELRRDTGDILVDLDQAANRAFVDALLDTEPHDLGERFRDRLYRLTGGHALFTVELLRAMKEHGDLALDESGRWTENETLDWQRWPARVDAIIAERIESLRADLRAMLTVAAVQGEEFTAEVVASALGYNEKDTVERLSGALARELGLITPARIELLPSANSRRRRSHYRFRHALFQKYLYDHQDDMERACLHEAVGNALENLHQGDEVALSGLSPSLARHFEIAGLTDKAVDYLLESGRRANALAAYDEALGLLLPGT